MNVTALGEIRSEAPNVAVPPGVTDMVYAYRPGDWCGHGEAIAWGAGCLYRMSLSHCSCYGPFSSFEDDANGWTAVTPGELASYLGTHARHYDPESSSVGQEEAELAYLLLQYLTANRILEVT